MGGLVGYIRDAKLRNTYATGNVTAGDDHAGGLVGYITSYNNSARTIHNSYATGNVIGGSNESLGGLVGHASYTSDIRDSYATGSVAGANFTAGLLGYADGITINGRNYYVDTDEADGVGNENCNTNCIPRES